MIFKQMKWLPKIQEDRWLVFYLLSILAGLFTFFVIVSLFLPGGINEKEEGLIFILAWIVCPISAFLCVIAMQAFQKRYFAETDRPLWVLLAYNALVFAILSTSLNILWQWKQYTTSLHFAYSAILFICLSNVLLMYWMRNTSINISLPSLYKLFLLGSLGLINFFVLFPDPLFYQTPPLLLLLSLICGTLLAIVKSPSFSNRPNRFFILGLDILVVLMIVLACFDPNFSIDPHHQNFYLGPVNRVLHGGTMLTDTFSQYGVLVIYFISAVFKSGIIPFTYQGLSLLAALLFMLHFVTLYVILIMIFKSRWYAILLLGILVLLGFFATMGQIQAYPSTGPVRFGLGYFVLVMVFIRKHLRIAQRYGLFLEYCLVGIASLWSFETFIYTAFSYLGICWYESFVQALDLRQRMKSFLWRIMWFFFSLVVFQLVFVVFTFFRDGTWPNWATYISFINAYSSLDNGFGTFLIYPWGYWFVMVLVYFASLAMFIFRFFFLQENDDSPQSVFIFGLTLLGIAFFTYFLGRSHPNNLYHVSTPAIIIAVYGYTKLNKLKVIPSIFRSASKVAFCSAVILIILLQTPFVLSKIQQNHTGYLLAVNGQLNAYLWDNERNILQKGSGDIQVADAVKLIEKYVPNNKYATVFVSPKGSTEILMISNRIHRFPINDVAADIISAKFFQELIDYPNVLKVNDVIFLLHDPLSYEKDIQYNKLQIFMLDKLCRDFYFENIETASSGVAAIRLLPHTTTPDLYCESIDFLKENTIWRLPE